MSDATTPGVLTIRQLLMRPPLEIIQGEVPGYFCGPSYNHMPEFIDDVTRFDYDMRVPHLETWIMFKWHMDVRRFWRSALHRYLGTPFMLSQNGGREGDDHEGRQVINDHVYLSAGRAIRAASGQRIRMEDKPPPLSLDTPRPELTQFYGKDLMNPPPPGYDW